MKVVINITKKSLFILCFILVAFTSILIVYAVPPTSPQPVGSAIYGHTASELNPGAFGFGDGSFYIFLNPVNIQRFLTVGETLTVGKVGTGQQQGVIYLQSGPAADVNKNINIDNTYGDFRVSNNAWAEIFRVENDGDVKVIQGKNLCLGNDCRSSWPATQSTPTFEVKIWCNGAQGTVASNSGQLACPNGWSPAGSVNNEGTAICWDGDSFTTFSNNDAAVCYRTV